jgi:hypothetical protein
MNAMIHCRLARDAIGGCDALGTYHSQAPEGDRNDVRHQSEPQFRAPHNRDLEAAPPRPGSWWRGGVVGISVNPSAYS